MPNLDPFQNTDGIPVGQDAENLSLGVARVGACRVGAFRVGFVGSPGDVADLHSIGDAGSVVGGDYGWRDRHLPEPSENQAPTVTIPGPQAAHGVAINLSVAEGNAVTVSDPDDYGAVEQMDILASGGLLALSGDTNNITIIIQTATHILFTGTIDFINSAMDTMSFSPLANGAFTVTFTINDLGHTGAGGAKTDQKILAVTADSFGL